MHYLIDGHNLIGQLDDISLRDPNDEALLVQKLSGFCARTGHKVTVVFDHGLPGGKSKMSTGVVQVVFAATPGIADRIIIERMRSLTNPTGWTIVSSDFDVLDAARERGMKALRSADFAEQLKPLPKPTKDSPKPPKDVYVSPREVEEWLKIFGDGKTRPTKKPKKP